MSPRFVVVTGAGRGLGRALAEGFAAAGATVAGCGRTAETLSSLGRALGEPHAFEVVDVSSDAVEPWAAGLVARFGPPDLLLNNAALMNRPTELWKVPRGELRQMLEVNVGGVHNVVTAFVPAMVERRRGVVVNFSSGWGRSVSPRVAPYCATKFAVEGMTRALAEELPSGMAAVALNPGVIATEMLRAVWGQGADAYPTPAEWARRAVPFLASLGPAHNGRSLTVPG